jgi:hypothetical protein
MDITKLTPERAYRIKYGGDNFIIVDEIHIYKDNENKSFVLQNNKLRKQLYTAQELETILSEKEGFYDWEVEQEMVLKLVCCRYRHVANYVLFNPADNRNGKILTKIEILGDDINSEMYKCAPWAITNLFNKK